MKRQIAIIGAGIGGLYLGYKLKNKFEVTIFEKEKEIGGLLGSFNLNNKYIEKTYHHIFAGDKEIIDLIKELGLENKLIWKKENNAIYFNGKLFSFSGPMDLLKFPLLNLVDKLRLGLITIYLQRKNNFKDLENIKAYEWMRKYCGDKVYKIIWEPLLINKFGKDYKNVSMVWMWARIHFRGNSKLGYLRGGFYQIINKLSENLKIIHKEVKVGELKGYDFIIDTSPLDSVKYLGAVDVVFTSKQKLSKYYWHNINDLRAPFVAFISQSNMTDDYGKYVYYMGGYYPQDHKYFKVEDEIIYKEFFGYLKKMFKDFDEKLVEKKWVFKFKNAQHIETPLPLRGLLPLKKGEHQKVVHMNFAQIYPQDRGMNYAIREAKKFVASFQ